MLQNYIINLIPTIKFPKSSIENSNFFSIQTGNFQIITKFALRLWLRLLLYRSNLFQIRLNHYLPVKFPLNLLPSCVPHQNLFAIGQGKEAFHAFCQRCCSGLYNGRYLGSNGRGPMNAIPPLVH